MATFPQEFWESLRRVRSAPKSYGHAVYWFPTSDVYDFREYDRDADVSGSKLYGRERVDEVAEDLRLRGQQSAAWLLWDPEPSQFVGTDLQGAYTGMHLGEGNHRVAALRNRLDRPFILAAIDRHGRLPNRTKDTPAGVSRFVRWEGTPGAGNYFPKHPDPDDFPLFRGKAIRPEGLPGAPDDRAVVRALGNERAASQILGAMKKAGRVFGPVGAAVGVAAGLSDPAEALGATVGRAGDTRWAKRQVTPKMRREERRYYVDKRARQRAANPLTALLDNVEKKKRLAGAKKGAK